MGGSHGRSGGAESTMGEMSAQPGRHETLKGWMWGQSLQKMPWWDVGLLSEVRLEIAPGRSRDGDCGPVPGHARTGSQKSPKVKPTGGSRSEEQGGGTRRRADSPTPASLPEFSVLFHPVQLQGAILALHKLLPRKRAWPSQQVWMWSVSQPLATLGTWPHFQPCGSESLSWAQGWPGPCL